MKLKSTLLIFLMVFLAMNACKDLEEPDLPPVSNDPQDPKEDPNTPIVETLPTTPVQVLFPEGTSVNLENSKILSGLFEYGISTTGTFRSFVPSDEYVLAYLLDREDRAMLMGFLGKGKTELSARSTAEALVYFGMGIFSLPFELRDKYLSESHTIAELGELTEQLEIMVRQNPLALEQGQMSSLWRAAFEKLTKEGEVIDIRARVINVDASVKSGLQVFEYDFQNIKVRNNYRRRAHAFLYKQSFRDRDRKETVLLKNSDYNGSLKAKKDMEVGQVSVLDGVLGTVRNVVTLQGSKYFESFSDLLHTPLEPNESQAVYNVRVVGPGKSSVFAMTDAEEEKVFELNLEVAILDVVLPGIAQAVGLLAEFGESEYKVLFEFIESRVNNVPKLYELSKQGDIVAFGEGIFTIVIEELLDKGFQALLVNAGQKAYEKKMGVSLGDNPTLKQEFEDKVEKAMRVLKITDAVLWAINSGIIVRDVLKSTQLESFRVETNDIPFRLEKRDNTVSVNEQVDLKITKLGQLSNNQSYWVKWRTSGEYGVLRDKEGRAGQEIETNFTDMFYRAISNPSQIGDDAEDMVYAEVFVKEGENMTSIGKDSVIVKVKPIKLVIAPDGVTLSPGNGGTSEIRLYVENSTGGKLDNTEEYEYRYEWGTNGEYGLFNGYSVTENTENNVVRYVAMDEEVEKAEEEIFVKVYRMEKGTTDEKLFAEAKGKVKIENDENLKILQLPLTIFYSFHSNNQFGGGSYFLHASFPRDENYEEFTVRFYGYRKPTIPVSEGLTFSWSADKDPPSRIDLNGQLLAFDWYIEKFPEHLIGLYYLTGSSGRAETVEQNSAILRDFGGMLEVKIKLKN